MKHIWQLQEAKAKLSQLILAAAKEPQVITKHGVPEVVVLSAKRYDELTGKKKPIHIVDLFQNSPLMGLDIEFPRDKDSDREINL